MKRSQFVATIAALVASIAAGCGSTASTVNNQPPPPAGVTVTVTPSSATVQVGGVQQFTATVSPSGANQAVIWSLSGTGCTGASCGTIDATGKYTAQATVPNPPTVTVTASSVADPTKAVTATVTITGNNSIPTRPVSLAVAPDPSGKYGKFAYVANAGSNNVSMFTIDGATGALTSAGTIAAGTDPGSVAVHPSGKFVYVVNTGSNNVSMYAIDAATGVLTSTGTVAAAVNPWSVTVHTSGKFAYVANAGSNSVSMYAIDAATGVLTSTGTVGAGTRPDSVAVDPSGKFAYVANSISADVLMYTIDAATGSLTPTGPVAAGTAVSVAVHPSGKFAYVANCGDVVSISEISTFAINDATGTLTSIGRIDAILCPISVAVHPSGKFVYVASMGAIEFHVSGGVSMYMINASTGELASIGTIDAGLVPMSVAIDPSGKFAYVANWGSDNISMYSINATTGTLTLIGTIGI